MPNYSYVAKTLDNKKVTGTLEAVSPEALAQRLRVENKFVVKYKSLEKVQSVKRVKLKPMELADFSRQMANMLASGITIVKALGIMMTREVTPRMLIVYERLYKSISVGNTLSLAMTEPESKGTFPDYMINIIRAGEANGKLEDSAIKLAVYYEKEHKLNAKVKGAMVYPMILLGLTFAVVLLIFTVIMPSFFDLFADMELPLITQIVMAMSGALINYWYIFVVGVIILVISVSFLLKQEKVIGFIDKYKLNAPKIGKLMRIIYTARFSRTLSSLYSSGLSMINALNIGASVIGNKYIADQFDSVVKNIRNGTSLSTAIGEVEGFDSKLVSTIYIGEETGRLDNMLESVADAFDYEAEMATSMLVTFIEPVMIIFMAVIVGSIMLAVMMPIIGMYNNVGAM